MGKKYIVLAMISVLALSGCARLDVPRTNAGPQLASNDPAQAVVSPATAISASDIRTFINPSAAAKLSQKEQAEASSAQYYALQFGRPGAPRSWQGDTGASGRISVGPYVRVNSLDCRDFSHVVTVAGAEYERKGTACREMDGTWDAVDS